MREITIIGGLEDRCQHERREQWIQAKQ